MHDNSIASAKVMNLFLPSQSFQWFVIIFSVPSYVILSENIFDYEFSLPYYIFNKYKKFPSFLSDISKY